MNSKKLVADYFIDFLASKKITDVFGIPGGVVLEFINAELLKYTVSNTVINDKVGSGPEKLDL